MIRVNILSPGRFHVLDLARELDKNGFDVKFYSFVSYYRAKKYGLPRRCSASLFAVLAPILMVERCLSPHALWLLKIRRVTQDFITSLVMRKADITIAMSGCFYRSARVAKKRGELIIIERGSKHILEQKRILENIPTKRRKIVVDNNSIIRELEDYKLADYVSIPTEHVKRSFSLFDFPQKKLFVNPYGVDLSMFKTVKENNRPFDLIMVGNWSYQKGCDLIIEAVRSTGTKLLHVGKIIDLEFPNENLFVHIDAVDQSVLSYYYGKAKVFILPSRQEGLAMVQLQAMACNLPIIGSPDSGAEDLRSLLEMPEYVTIIKDYTVQSVIDAIGKAMNLYESLGEKIYASSALFHLTWEAYGKRYATFINKIMGQ